jgi:hypothetical protein
VNSDKTEDWLGEAFLLATNCRREHICQQGTLRFHRKRRSLLLLISEVVRKAHDPVTPATEPRANNYLQIRGPLLFVSSAGTGVPLSSYWYSMYIYATVVGGEVGEREALSSFKLKLRTLGRRVRGANDKARAINGPGQKAPYLSPAFLCSLGGFRVHKPASSCLKIEL